MKDQGRATELENLEPRPDQKGGSDMILHNPWFTQGLGEWIKAYHHLKLIACDKEW